MEKNKRSKAVKPASGDAALALHEGMAAVHLPPELVLEVQADYLREAEVIWNRVLQPAVQGAPAIADRKSVV